MNKQKLLNYLYDRYEEYENQSYISNYNDTQEVYEKAKNFGRMCMINDIIREILKECE